MSEQIMINAISRSELGSNRARNIRSDNMVPAVIYGNEKELLNVCLLYTSDAADD